MSARCPGPFLPPPPRVTAARALAGIGGLDAAAVPNVRAAALPCLGGCAARPAGRETDPRGVAAVSLSGPRGCAACVGTARTAALGATVAAFDRSAMHQ